MTTDRFQQERERRNRFADSLAAEYAADLPESVRDRVFSLAWEHGHANGEGDVEAYFIDFADVCGDAYRAGLEETR